MLAPNLVVTSSGPVTMTNAANDFDTVALQVAGAGNGVQLTDVDGLTVGTVGAVTGITAAGNVILTTTNGGAFTIAQPITTTNNGTLTLTNAGLLSLNANLDADGAITQNGAGAITTSGTRTLTTTNDAVTLNQAVTLGGDLTISSGTGPISFSSTIDGAGNLTANSTGTTTFAGAVGGVTPLTGLTTNAGGTTALNGGTVTTTGTQTYNDAVTLGADITLTSTGAGAITLGSTVNGAQSLTVNTGGATTWPAPPPLPPSPIGGGTPLTSVTTDQPGTVTVGSVTTTGAQNYQENTST